METIGIDIGGTAIKAGFVAKDGLIVARCQFPVEPNLEVDALVARLAALCRDLENGAGRQAAAIGISTPGFTDPAAGILVDGGGNVPALRLASLPAALSSQLARFVTIENDGVAAALGELRFGHGARYDRFVIVTLGTGVGGAVVLDRNIIRGKRGEPPEIGAIVLSDDIGDNGGLGTFEYHASASAFLRAYRQAGGGEKGLSVAELFERMHEDPATAAIDRVSRRIAQALGTLVNALNLEDCLIGGGIAAAGAPLIYAIRKHLPDFTWPYLLRQVTVATAATGNDAGLLGAAWLANDRLRRSH
jgi:glucokinase